MIPRPVFLAVGPALAALTGLLCAQSGMTAPATWTAAITTLCAVWWITEAIPIPVTSLIPFATLPLCGVMTGRQVAVAYGDPMILLLLGGFLLSKAVEKSGAHQRIAVNMVRLFGRSGRRGLVLGFMAATAICSMWISNSATVLMMLPVALAVLVHDQDGDLAVPLLLGIAYAASIGGLGTPIGTPPNVMFMGVYESKTGRRIDFLQWMTWGIPVVLTMVPLAWLLLCRKLAPGPATTVPSLGPWRSAERRVLIVFGLTAAAWILRNVPILGGGWSAWFGIPGAGDETVALAAVIAMFLVPSGERRGEKLLDWETAERIPWGILLLFAGGIAIAKAFDASGLSVVLGDHLATFAALPTIVVIGALCLAVTFLTEITSNTATTALLMPVLATAAVSADLEPRLLMVPAAMSASCAFMLPVATAPNAIVFGTGRITIARMAREGFILNLIGALAIGSTTLLLLRR